MTVPTMPATLVAAPPRTPLPYGLFSVLTFRTGDARWEGAGVEFEELVGCGPLQGVGHGGFCTDIDDVVGLPYDFDRTVTGMSAGTPFSVVAHRKCGLVGSSIAQARALAESRLVTLEERAVEHAFLTGMLGNEPNLRDATALTASPVPFKVGVGLLEEWSAAEYGSQGIIHAPRSVPAGDMRLTGQTYRTHLGTPIVFGAGYDGTGPTGSDPLAGAARWVYITPALAGYRSDVTVTDLFDREVNDHVAYAQRDYLITFEDCGVGAVLVEPAGLADGAVTVVDRAANPYLTA